MQLRSARTRIKEIRQEKRKNCERIVTEKTVLLAIVLEEIETRKSRDTGHYTLYQRSDDMYKLQNVVSTRYLVEPFNLIQIALMIRHLINV